MLHIKNTTISYDLVRDIADETYMPNKLKSGWNQILFQKMLNPRYLKLGAERVIINDIKT